MKKFFCAAVIVAGGVLAGVTHTALTPVMLSPPGNDDVVGRQSGGRRLQAAHHQDGLRLQAERIGVEAQHLEVVDAVQGGIPEHRRLAPFIAASVDHGFPRFTNVCTCVTSLFSSEYDTVTVSTRVVRRRRRRTAP